MIRENRFIDVKTLDIVSNDLVARWMSRQEILSYHLCVLFDQASLNT